MSGGFSSQGLKGDSASAEYTFTRFFQVAEEHPDRTALVYLGTPFSYGWLRAAVDQFAGALHGLGVGHRDRVMLYLPNCPQWIIANFAVQRLGAVVVPVSPIYTAHELQYMIEDAQVETVVCQDTNFGYVNEVHDRTCLEHIVVTTLTELLPWWKTLLGHLLDKVPKGKVAKGPHIHRFGALLKSAVGKLPDVEIDALRDLATIMYTGGTTGVPKGVPGNHATEVSYIREVMHEVFDPEMRAGEDRVVMVNPLYHIMAKGFMIAAGLNYGNTVILMPMPQVDTLLAEIEHHRARWFLGVPALYRMILENDRVDQYDLGSLRFCFSGGDVLPQEVFSRWRERTGASIYQVYGSTEVGHVAYSRLDQEPSTTAIGRPLSSYRCLVVDPETLAPSAPGEVGELLVSADFNIKSYWNKPDETQRSYVPIGEDVFYRMGDFVRLDEEGAIQFVERTADVIKHKGYRISASEVEAVLQDHPTVIEACVVGVQDPAVGERLKAIVVLKHDAKGVSGVELKKWCRKHLASYKVPDHVEFRDMLPKSKVGKLLRREVRDEERRKASGSTGPESG